MKALLLANTDWYLANFRLGLARAIRDAGHEVVLAAPPGPFVERLEGDGFAFRAVGMDRRSRNPWTEARAVRELAALYRREGPDLVHHFTLQAVVQGSFAARRAGVGAVVNAVAGLGYAFTDPGARARLTQAALRPVLRRALAASETVVQNPDDRDALLALRLADPARLHVIRGSGVDTRRFRPQPEPDGAPTVVLASRMLRAKGADTLVEAMPLVREQIPDARAVLVGAADGGNPDAIPEAELQAWDARPGVEWWGFRDEMESVLAQAHVVCLPSRYGEGVPRVLIEGAALGRPLVSTDRPGCREIVRDGETGRLVPPADPQALAAALIELLGDAELRRRLGTGARALAVRSFSSDRVTADTFGVYRRVAPGFDGPSARPPEPVE